MKIKLLTFYFFIIALCALPMGCFKKQAPSVDTTNLQNTTQAPINTNNLDQLHQMVDEAQNITPEIFFAITTLHHEYTKELEDAIDINSGVDYEKLFEEKRIDFFNTIKFSYEQYMNYYENNLPAINEYLQERPDLIEQLIILQ